MVYVTDGADINMWLCPLKFFLGHSSYLLKKAFLLVIG
jgi:hypothetical protein